jgi:hypothetical protein
MVHFILSFWLPNQMVHFILFFWLQIEIVHFILSFWLHPGKGLNSCIFFSKISVISFFLGEFVNENFKFGLENGKSKLIFNFLFYSFLCTVIKSNFIILRSIPP